MLLSEVAPAAPALGPLVSLALLLVAFGIVYVVRRFLQAVLGWLSALASYIPGAGGLVAGWIHSAEQAVASALGSAEHSIDHAMGASWHLLARYMDWLWREIRGHAVLILESVTLLGVLVDAYRQLRALVHHLTRTNTASSARVKTLEREYKGIEAKVRTLEREYAHGIGEDVLPRIKKLEREAAQIETVQLPAAQAAQRQAESAINNLYDWAKGKASLLGVGTFTGAVAAALTTLGLGGLRCDNNPLKNKDCGSGVWNDLSELLSLAAGLLAVTDLEALLKDAEAVEVEVVTLAREALGLD